MEKIPPVAYTTDVPDEVLAQAVAGTADWQRDNAGAIYDQEGIFVASSLSEAAAAMQALGWITPPNSPSSGVIWHQINAAVLDAYEVPKGEPPPSNDWGTLVRHAVRAIR